MHSSEALTILKTRPAPKVEVDLDFIKAINGSVVEKTLLWSNEISLPFIDNKGLRDFCQLNTDKASDAISAQPLSWGLTLKEIQVTKAIRLFLDVDTEHRHGRIESFLNAFGVEISDDVSDYYVANEHAFDGGRFDIMIAWDKSGEKYNHGLVCEFKLGSEIHSGQLKKYEKASKGIIKQCDFAFISEAYKTADFHALRTSTKSWTTRLWWKFLRDWENQISDEIDDNEFRQFRATLWDQLA